MLVSAWVNSNAAVIPQKKLLANKQPQTVPLVSLLATCKRLKERLFKVGANSLPVIKENKLRLVDFKRDAPLLSVGPIVMLDPILTICS